MRRTKDNLFSEIMQLSDLAHVANFLETNKVSPRFQRATLFDVKMVRIHAVRMCDMDRYTVGQQMCSLLPATSVAGTIHYGK